MLFFISNCLTFDPVLAKVPLPVEIVYDPQNTGRSIFSGPDKPLTIRWYSNLFSIIGEINGTVYGISRDGVVSIDPYSGHPTILLRTEECVVPVFINGGIFYLGLKDFDIGTSDERSMIFLLNSDGTYRWKVETDRRYYATYPPIIKNNTVYLYASGALYVIDLWTGKVKWKTISGDRWSGVAIGVDGTVYAGSFNAYYPDGRLKWSLPLSVDGAWPVVSDDGTVFMIGYLHDLRTLFAINPDGTIKWKKPEEEGRYPYRSPSLGWDGTIYMLYPKPRSWGSAPVEASIVAIDPKDGSEKWSFDLTAIVTRLPSVYIDSNNIIYAIGADEIYALNADGTIKWTFPISGVRHIAFGSNNVLYLNVEEGCYALQGPAENGATTTTTLAPGAPYTTTVTTTVTKTVTQPETVTITTAYTVTKTETIPPQTTTLTTTTTEVRTETVTEARTTVTTTRTIVENTWLEPPVALISAVGMLFISLVAAFLIARRRP